MGKSKTKITGNVFQGSLTEGEGSVQLTSLYLNSLEAAFYNEDLFTF